MVSCTEFIPLYSEFFKFLESKGGYDNVLKYWYHISDTSLGDKTNPHSLVSFIERFGGYEGAIAYWQHTTSEEACDIYKFSDPVKRYTYSHMRYCPSRAMLNSLEHIEPYHNYCEHCKIIYSRVLEKYGVVFERDHSKIDNAECSSVLYEVGNKPEGDFTIPSKDAVVTDMKREDNKYLHRDFHLLGDNALKYCGDVYGDESVVDFLRKFAADFYAPQIKDAKERGLVALKEWIERTYEVEEASDVLHTELKDDVLTVSIDKCPVIEYMHTLNQEPSKYYKEETETLYAAVADACGFGFELEYYYEDGKTKFKFFKRTC